MVISIFSLFLYVMMLKLLQLNYCSIAVKVRVFEMGFGVLNIIGEEFFYIRDVDDVN